MVFYDLSIQFDPTDTKLENLGRTLLRLRSYGFSCVAINFIAPIKDVLKSNSPIPIEKIRSLYASDDFTILTRLTAIVEDANVNYQVASSSGGSLKNYDIIAVRPTTMTAFQFVSGTFDADIISIDVSIRMHFFLKYPTINQALNRGLVFEIPYSPAIRDITQRRHLITNSASLMRVVKNNGLLITSDARSDIEIRDPYAIAAIASVFGMSTTSALEALSNTGRKVIYRAKTRMSEKSILQFAI